MHSDPKRPNTGQSDVGPVEPSGAADLAGPDRSATPDNAADVEARDIVVKARDGRALAASVFCGPAPRAGLLISSATGYPRRFYRSFALEAAARGYCALTYDCRGIGGSAPDEECDLALLDMDYTDWGRLDTPGAIDALAERARQAGLAQPRLLHVGHSVGGHFLGFADNQELLSAHAFVCVGSGFWRKHAFPAPLREAFFWYVYGPRQIARHGYVPAGGLWGGAALPRGVFETWRRWCLQPRYFLDELETRLRPHHFDAVRAPIRSFIYADDPIANLATARDMLKVYPNAPSEIVQARPADLGVKAIGHDGPFRRANEPARAPIFDWLAAQV